MNEKDQQKLVKEMRLVYLQEKKRLFEQAKRERKNKEKPND